MSGHDIVFVLIAIMAGGGAILTVTSRNLIHAALFLATALAGIGSMFLLLRADFLGMVQVVVYIGAISVLFLFGLMLTRAPIGREALDGRSQPMALAVSSVLFVILTFLIVRAFKDVPTNELTSSSVSELGIAIFSTWVFPFEVVSMLLLAALVGAILLARREDGESGDATAVEHIATAPSTPADDAADAREAALEQAALDAGDPAITAGPGGDA